MHMKLSFSTALTVLISVIPDCLALSTFFLYHSAGTGEDIFIKSCRTAEFYILGQHKVDILVLGFLFVILLLIGTLVVFVPILFTVIAILILVVVIFVTSFVVVVVFSS